jgi:hypothetical protein
MHMPPEFSFFKMDGASPLSEPDIETSENKNAERGLAFP